MGQDKEVVNFEEYDELVDKKTCFVIIYYINLSEIIGDLFTLDKR